MAKKKPSTHNMHALIICCSVIAGLALAACQPQLIKKEPVQQSPAPSPVSMMPPATSAGKVKGAMTTNDEVDASLNEMDASFKSSSPTNLTGSDIR